jgi:hypothetical protein
MTVNQLVKQLVTWKSILAFILGSAIPTLGYVYSYGRQAQAATEEKKTLVGRIDALEVRMKSREEFAAAEHDTLVEIRNDVRWIKQFIQNGTPGPKASGNVSYNPRPER